MKFRSLIYAMSLLLAAPFFAACNDDDTKEEVTTIETTRIKNVTHDSAVAVSYIVGNYSDRGICYSENQNPTIAGKTLPAVGNIEFESEITGLTSGKTYYVRTYAIVNGQPVYGAQKSFTTLSDGQPIVTIGDATNIKETTAELSAFVMSTGGKEVTARGIAWVKDEGDLDEIVDKITSTGTIPDDVMDRAGAYVDSENATGELKATATDLADESDYGYVAFVVADGEVFHSDVATFVTEAFNTPIAAITNVYDVTATTVTVDATTTADNELEILARGIAYGTKNDVSLATDVAAANNGYGEYTVTLDNLASGELYYIWAYAENRKGRSYSKVSSARTISNLATVEVSVDDIYAHAATGALKISNLGAANAAVTEVGLIYSTEADPTVDNGTKIEISDVPALNVESSVAFSNLVDGTTYHVRGYAVNEHGTSYSADVEFATRPSVFVSNVRLFDGGLNLPYFNGFQSCVVQHHSSFGVTTPSGVCTEWWNGVYDNIARIVAASSSTEERNLCRIGGQFNALDEAGEDMYICITIRYRVGSSTSNVDCSAWFKLSRNADGSYVGGSSYLINTNYTNLRNASSTEDSNYIRDLVQFFTEPFYCEWVSPDYVFTESFDTANAPVRFVNKADPSKTMCFTTINWSGMKPSNPGWK